MRQASAAAPLVGFPVRMALLMAQIAGNARRPEMRPVGWARWRGRTGRLLDELKNRHETLVRCEGDQVRDPAGRGRPPRRLRRFAREHDRSISRIVSEAVAEYLESGRGAGPRSAGRPTRCSRRTASCSSAWPGERRSSSSLEEVLYLHAELIRRLRRQRRAARQGPAWRARSPDLAPATTRRCRCRRRRSCRASARTTPSWTATSGSRSPRRRSSCA